MAADVCVIGAGLAGLTTALELARLGTSVVLLEAGRVACGASGRNGGFVSNGFALGIESIEAHVGRDAARRIYAQSRKGTEYVRAMIAAHDPSIQMGNGLRVCARYDDNGGLHQHGKDLMQNHGEVVSLNGVDATRAALDTQRYFDSIVLEQAFHIHPLRYAMLLQRRCQELGVRVFENSRAMHVSKQGAGFEVQCAAGKIMAQHVVHCVSATDSKIHPPTGRALLPVSTYVAVTEPLQQHAIATRNAIADTRRAGDYYRLIDEGRILWGGRITTRISEPKALAEVMRRDMVSTFPQLHAVRMQYAWPGIMGYALHKMPLIGCDVDGKWFATGFGGHGLNTTAMGGVLIAAAIANGDDTYKLFAPFAPRWAFGPLGQLGVQASYWMMQAKDRRDEATRTAIRR